MNLDVLPPKCSVEAQIKTTPDGLLFVRFQATQNRRFREPIRSEWSGWFLHEGEPIQLTWDTFWEPPSANVGTKENIDY